MNDAHPTGEVPERARRRTFTAAYKLKVLAEYEAAELGRRGEVLRRFGPGATAPDMASWPCSAILLNGSDGVFMVICPSGQWGDDAASSTEHDGR